MRKSKKFGSKIFLYDCKNGDVTYYITFKHKGKLIWKKVGRRSEGVNEYKCLEVRNRILSELRHGVDISYRVNKQDITLDFLAQRYFEYGRIHIKSIEKYIALYNKHIRVMLGRKPLSQMNDSDILRVQRTLRDKGLSDATNNFIVQLIKRIVNWGIKNSYFDYMPFKNIKYFKLNNARERYLTNKEINTLFFYAPDEETKLFLFFALSTGARANAILNIRKKDIDLENKTILLSDDKGKTTYVGFLNDEVANYISSFFHQLDPMDFVITKKKTPLKIGTLRYRLKKIFDRLNEGIDPKDRKNRVVIHTLRHTFASHLAINGASVNVIKKLLNHKDIKQTMRYAKLGPESGKKYVEKLYQLEERV